VYRRARADDEPDESHGTRLLDVGCGVGLLLRAAQRRGVLVAGVDTAADRLEVARWALPDADLREGDPDALPFADGTFDVATASGGAAVLAELVRVVRPGGRVASGGWAHPAGCWAETFGEHLRLLARGPPAGLEAELAAAGLATVATGEVSCPAEYPSLAAAWTALLGSEQLLAAIRIAGERAVHDAFLASVEPAVGAGGTVERHAGDGVAERLAQRDVTAADFQVTGWLSFVGSANDRAAGADSTGRSNRPTL
jgi:SAM-dependent methyltransferase